MWARKSAAREGDDAVTLRGFHGLLQTTGQASGQLSLKP